MKIEDVEWDEWRHNLVGIDGTILVHNVLMIRGTVGNISFQTPAFHEDKQDLNDSKRVILRAIERQLADEQAAH